MIIWEFDAATCADTLKQLRLDNQLTQKKLAELANVNVNTIFNYESGGRLPHFPQLLKIAKVLKVDEIRIDTSKEWYL